MKRSISVILALLLAMWALSVSAFADSTAKINIELQEAIAESIPDDLLNVEVWFAYPGCPEPDFTVEDYGETIEQVNRYLHDYRAYKRDYYTEQNQKAVDQLTGAADLEVNWRSDLVPAAIITLKAKDVAALAELPIVGELYVSHADAVAEPAEEPDDGGQSDALTLEEKFEQWMLETYHMRKLDPDKDCCDYTDPFFYGGYTELYSGDGWTLIRADDLLLVETPWEMPYEMEFAGRMIKGLTGASDAEHAYPYYLYSVAGDTFVNICNAYESDYPGIARVLRDANIGTAIVLTGDVDGDLKVDNRDAMILDRYVADWDGYAEYIVDISAADLNRDEDINNRDAMILDRCAASWKGYDKYIKRI